MDGVPRLSGSFHVPRESPRIKSVSRGPMLARSPLLVLKGQEGNHHFRSVCQRKTETGVEKQTVRQVV